MRNSTATNRLIIESLHEALLKRAGEELRTRGERIEICRVLTQARAYTQAHQIAQSLDEEIGHFYSCMPLGNPLLIDIGRIEDIHKPRVILSVAQAYTRAGDWSLARELLKEASQIAFRQGDHYTIFEAGKEVAVGMSLQGDHTHALNHLETLRPFMLSASRTSPVAYFNYLNSRAVELSNLGKYGEAIKLANIALLSPYASQFPEWRETVDEIFEKRESSMVVLIDLPEIVLPVIRPLRLRLPEGIRLTPSSARNNLLRFPTLAMPENKTEVEEQALVDRDIDTIVQKAISGRLNPEMKPGIRAARLCLDDKDFAEEVLKVSTSDSKTIG